MSIFAVRVLYVEALLPRRQVDRVQMPPERKRRTPQPSRRELRNHQMGKLGLIDKVQRM
jgi:hypothetical protein